MREDNICESLRKLSGYQ